MTTPRTPTRLGRLAALIMALGLVVVGACTNPVGLDDAATADHTTSSGNHTTSSGNASKSDR